MKIELDEKTIDNLVNYFIDHPHNLHKVIKMCANEMLSVLRNEKMLKEGASLYRNIMRSINDSYKDDG